MELKIQETSAACAPRLLVSVLNGLSVAQIEKVKELGFGGILHLHPISLRLGLCRYLVDCYDNQRDIFKIKNSSLPITTWDVVCILGILDEGNKIKDNKHEPNEIMLKSYVDTQTNEITLSSLATSISSNEDVGEHFIRRFVLLMIGTVLAPKIRGIVPKRFLNLVEDVAKIPDYNWAEFTRCELKKGILKFKKERKGCFQGNLLLLQECMEPSDQIWMKLASFEERLRSIEDKVSYVPIIHDMLKKLLLSPAKDVRMPSKAFDSNDTSKENTPDSIQCNDGIFSDERKEWCMPDLNEPVTFEKGVPEDIEICCGEEKVEHSLFSSSNQKTTEDKVSTPADKPVTANQKHKSLRRSVLMNPKMSQLVRKLSAIDALAIQFVRDYTSSAPAEVLVQITGAELTGSTLCKLIGPDDWLCEKIMDCYIDLVSNS